MRVKLRFISTIVRSWFSKTLENLTYSINSMTRVQNKNVAVWLLLVCAVVFGMIVLGGVTRLTGSGLSMVEWKPIMGILPPLNLEQWMASFDLYKSSPEFLKINHAMELDDYKSIFWFEYLHRLLGRGIGLLFFVPMVYFFFKYPLGWPLKLKLLGLFFLGGAQGLLGWYLVKSGLVDNPHVSQYRLVAHLGLAMLLYAALFWIALGLLLQEFKHRYPLLPLLKLLSLAAVILVYVTILAGGFVAGIKAGFAFNTFPLINGHLIPEGYLALSPWWANLFKNIASVQFNHRLLATLSALLVLVLIVKGLRGVIEPKLRMAFKLLAAALIGQYLLGLLTLLLYVPTSLAALHQAGAVLLLSASLLAARLVFCRSAP